MDSGDLIMVGRGSLWVVAVKNGWSWVIVSGGVKIMVGRRWSHDLVMPHMVAFIPGLSKWLV